MSNNKQGMQLYTEEQVLRMLEVCRDSDLYEHILTFEGILKTETPIELPSDEEMSVRALKTISELNPKLIENEEAFYIAGFVDGAKWMRDKIQGGNK